MITTAADEMMAEEEKPIVALEKERVCMQVVEDEYQHIRHHHQQQLSSLSDLVSRHSIDSLDQECGHTAEDPDDGNYPGSCLSAEDSGIHTEDMSSCVSQADDEERSNLQPSPVSPLQQQPSNVVQQHVDDAYNNMVRDQCVDYVCPNHLVESIPVQILRTGIQTECRRKSITHHNCFWPIIKMKFEVCSRIVMVGDEH